MCEFAEKSETRYADVARARTVVCSPHFDDAVLSCWSVLDRNENCAVVNVFTGAPGGGFISWYDQQNRATSSAAHMHQRSIEDRDALSLAGKQAVNLGMWEVQYRLRQSALLHKVFRRLPPLRFAMLRLPLLRPLLYGTPAPDAARIADAIAHAAPAASILWVPAAIGGHRDHLIVRQAGSLLASRGMNVRLYADLPYAVIHGWPKWVGTPEGARKKDRASAFWERHIKALRQQVGDPIERARVVALTPQERVRKEQAVRRHATQIHSLNSGRTRGRLDEKSTFAYEVHWELLAASGAARV
jgi:hypothetical protein